MVESREENMQLSLENMLVNNELGITSILYVLQDSYKHLLEYILTSINIDVDFTYKNIVTLSFYVYIICLNIR